MKQSEEPGEESFVSIKIKTMNQTTYEIIINPLKNIKSFQNQIEQVTTHIARKPKSHPNRRDCYSEGLYSILISPGQIIVSNKEMLCNLLPISCHLKSRIILL